ncbi:hypothetical protein BGZ60DRAFT_535595 [Tricladium varicosporioides]|nr:hypothetical protein BGZ60DRAFT_535595 [Hymenoscyphus varicosporioides]
MGNRQHHRIITGVVMYRQNSSAHGGGYVPGQQSPPSYPSYSQSSQRPSQQHPSTTPEIYQTSSQAACQSQIISRGVSSPPQPSSLSEKRAWTSAAEDSEVREYNDIPISKKSVHLKGALHFFDGETKFRFKWPHLYQLPAFQYDTPHSFRHRDSMMRVYTGPVDDRYLSPWDGHLAKLHVQATDGLYDSHGTTTWRRTYIRNVAPWNVRIATWPIDSAIDAESWKDWAIVLLKFIPCSFLLTFFVLGKDTVVIRDHLRFAPFPYKFHGYLKVARNQLESAYSRGSPRAIQRTSASVNRLLRPRYLCFLERPEDDQMHGVNTMAVSTWQTQHHTDQMLNYLFIAYSTEHFNHSSADDLEALHQIAERAARDAKLPAYWIACSCMPDVSEVENDVYRISDVMRGAEAMVIVVGNPASATHTSTTADLLKQWGRRMWTFPEVLLSQKNEVKVYTRGGKLGSPMIVPKKQFAAEVWAIDATVSRQLIDHYDGTLHLSRLELVVLALLCLQARQTTQYLPGDHSYALMGLLRLRPQVDNTDSAFQAFARLSLINDSDLLLERLICTLPKKPNQPWHDMTDAYGSSLWDIYPDCQVAGVGEDDTVVIDGAYATSIRWKAFHRIWYFRRFTWKRWFSWKLLHCASWLVLIGIILMGTGGSMAGAGAASSSFSYSSYAYYDISAATMYVGVGVLFFLLGGVLWLMAPRLLTIILGGKFWNTQAAVFGFEGYLNLATIERSIFGGSFGRLSWSTNGSPLSRHMKNEFGECVGLDPTEDHDVRTLVDQAKKVGPGEQRIFTLIDTYSMTVTLIQAIRPPVALVICGSEGGMKRAVACSYDWTSSTLYRETVIRMPTTTLNRMDRVPRLKFGLQRPVDGVAPRRLNREHLNG